MNRVITFFPYLLLAYFSILFLEYLNVDPLVSCGFILLAVFFYYGYKDIADTKYDHLITKYEEMSYSSFDDIIDNIK